MLLTQQFLKKAIPKEKIEKTGWSEAKRKTILLVLKMSRVDFGLRRAINVLWGKKVVNVEDC